MDNGDLYKKVEEFVTDSFTKAGRAYEIKHFKRTVYWLQQLRPDADEALLIAAIAHDIERAFRDSKTMWSLYGEKGQGFRGDVALKYHPEKGAEIVGKFLRKQNADPKIIERVKSLVAKHEVGGDDDQNLLKDTDSISFFENQVENFLTNIVKKTSKERVKEKFDWMFNRITSDKAKEIARPWYEDALKKLGEV